MNRNQLTHARTVAQYSDNLLEAVIEDLSHRNLRRTSQEEGGWWMRERSTAARAERRKRKEGATA
jgi:hypothetical protein